MPSKGPYVPQSSCLHQSTMSREEQRGDELWYVIICLQCGNTLQEGRLGKTR